MGQLIVTRGLDQGTRITIDEFPVSIGRGEGNKVIINDSEVSRFHARIKQRERIFILEDLDSRNGLFLNGDKVFNTVIQNGDRILVGSTELVFLVNQPEIQLTGSFFAGDQNPDPDSASQTTLQLEHDELEASFDSKRLNISDSFDIVAKSSDLMKKVFDNLSGLPLRTEIQDLGKIIVKSMGELIPESSKSCLFLWEASTRKLIPLASKHFKNPQEKFSVSERSLYDCINRKQPLILTPRSLGLNQTRIIIPFIVQNDVIAVSHIETTKTEPSLKFEELSTAITLAGTAAHYLDGMILRQEKESYMLGMIESLVAAIEAKDTYTLGHSERVCKYSIAIGDHFHLSRDLKKQLMISALCHDVGKIGVPDAILKKAALLSTEEYEEMKLHPTIGAKIIERLPNAVRFLGGIKHHHEKWDGTGYPDGLAGEDIPFFGRIIAVADAFDAMVSGRSYSGFIDASDAIQKLNEESELFDPEVIKAFNKAWESGIISQKSDTKAR